MTKKLAKYQVILAITSFILAIIYMIFVKSFNFSMYKLTIHSKLGIIGILELLVGIAMLIIGVIQIIEGFKKQMVMGFIAGLAGVLVVLPYGWIAIIATITAFILNIILSRK